MPGRSFPGTGERGTDVVAPFGQPVGISKFADPRLRRWRRWFSGVGAVAWDASVKHGDAVGVLYDKAAVY